MIADRVGAAGCPCLGGRGANDTHRYASHGSGSPLELRPVFLADATAGTNATAWPIPCKAVPAYYILTLSKGSRSQLISERFSRMISARRSMSA